MPRLVVFGLALALSLALSRAAREAVVAAQPRDEATLAPAAGPPHLRDEPVPRAPDPRNDAVHAPQPSAPPHPAMCSRCPTSSAPR